MGALFSHAGVRPDGSRYTPDWKKQQQPTSSSSSSLTTTPESTSAPASLPDLTNDTDADSSRAPSVHLEAAPLPPETGLEGQFKQALQLEPNGVGEPRIVTPA